MTLECPDPLIKINKKLNLTLAVFPGVEGLAGHLEERIERAALSGRPALGLRLAPLEVLLVLGLL